MILTDPQVEKMQEVHNEVLGLLATNLPPGNKTAWDFNEVLRLMSMAFLKGENNAYKRQAADMEKLRADWQREREAIAH